MTEWVKCSATRAIWKVDLNPNWTMNYNIAMEPRNLQWSTSPFENKAVSKKVIWMSIRMNKMSTLVFSKQQTITRPTSTEYLTALSLKICCCTLHSLTISPQMKLNRYAHVDHRNRAYRWLTCKLVGLLEYPALESTLPVAGITPVWLVRCTWASISIRYSMSEDRTDWGVHFIDSWSMPALLAVKSLIVCCNRDIVKLWHGIMIDLSHFIYLEISLSVNINPSNEVLFEKVTESKNLLNMNR